MPFSFVKAFAQEQHRVRVTLPRAEKLRTSLSNLLGNVDSLLDVGSGDGAIAKSLAETTGARRVVGVDVLIRPERLIEVIPYDGLSLPFPDRSFDAVTLIDVLHHCVEPLTVMKEALRVASRMVVIKDHFAFGPISRQLLYWMDVAGNSRDGVFSPGTYLEPRDWVAMIRDAGGKLSVLDWPLAVHALPWRAVVRPELHFIAKVVPASL